MKKNITLRDIGEKLGLSAMTVSLALRDHPRISTETKDRVRATMDQRIAFPDNYRRHRGPVLLSAGLFYGWIDAAPGSSARALDAQGLSTD